MQATTTTKNSVSWVPVIVSAMAVFAVCAFIFYMSERPADESDALSLDFVWHIVGFIVPGYDQMSAAEQLNWQEMLNYPVRKLAHFTEFAILGALVLNLLVQIKRRQLATETLVPASALGPYIKRICAAAWSFATLYAVTDEIHQIFVPGRTGKPTDVLIDSAGILFGILIVALVLHLIAKRKQRTE